MSTNGKVWQEVKLPPGKILVPGVVSHSCVGRENHGRRSAHREPRISVTITA